MAPSALSPTPLAAEERCLGSSPRCCVIWLHGLGADGHDFIPIVRELQLPDALAVRFIFPHAPVRPVTINGGLAMRAWYDFLSLDLGKGENAEDIEHSVRAVQALIEGEVARGIAPRQIVLAGFSQGGVIALHAGLRYREPLGGLIVLSSYLPRAEQIEHARVSAGHTALPIFIGHGQFDELIPLPKGQELAQRLRDWGHEVSFHEYPMAHAVCPEEIRDMRAWVVNICGETVPE